MSGKSINFDDKKINVKKVISTKTRSYLIYMT